MSTVTLVPSTSAAPYSTPVDRVLLLLVNTLQVSFLGQTGSSISNGSYSGGSASSDSVAGTMDTLNLTTPLQNAVSLSGVQFDRGSLHYVVKANGDLQVSPAAASGVGTKVGTMSATSGQIQLTNWASGTTTVATNFRGAAAAPINGPYTPYNGIGAVFRTAASPIRSGSFTLLGTMADGTTFNTAADANGRINHARVKGLINYTTGVVRLYFVTPTAAGTTGQVDLTFLGISGVGLCYPDAVKMETVRYNAVSFSYLPLDATILGVDPVRLPSDGRVPIFRPGGVAVIGNKAVVTNTYANGDTVNFGRVRISRVRVLNSAGTVINATGVYSTDLEAGTLTFINVAGLAQPLTVENRIEDMLTITDAQINGLITFNRPVTHSYPVGSYMSSALLANNLKARVSIFFDQTSWDQTYSDAIVGTPALATYNTGQYPMVLTNRGATTERWALQFTSTTAFNIIGEHVGVIGVGTTSGNVAPINPATATPYFTLNALGFGTGWAAGNVIRFNTVGALFPVWVIRTVQMGAATVIDDKWTMLVRGDVDRP